MLSFIKIKPCTLFKEFDKTIFDYPKWKHLIPGNPTEDEFKRAWHGLFRFDYEDCAVEYGKQELSGNSLGSGLIVRTPNMLHLCGFQEYTDNPILREDQSFYYSGGVTWGIDAIGRRFSFIDPSKVLPVYWDEVYNWEIIKRYSPFVIQLFKAE